MFAFADFVKATTTTTGTGDITLGSSPTGFRSFADGFTDGDVTDVLVVDNPSAPTQWEVFEATYNDLATDTLTRGTLRSSSTGSRINFSAGTKTVVAAPSALFYDLIAQSINADIDATGSSGVYAVTTPAGIAPARGYRITFKANHDNPGACTINPDSKGAESIKLSNGDDPHPGAIKQDGLYTVEYDSTNFQLRNPTPPEISVGGNIIAPHENLIVQRASVSTVDIDADAVLVKDTNGNALRLESIDLTADITASGANGLDTGSEGNNWYYLWVIYNPSTDTTASLLSLSSTSPTMPSGYTHKALVGSVRNDGGDFDDFYQRGRVVNLENRTVATNLTATSFTSQSIPQVSPLATKIRGTLGCDDTSAGSSLMRVAANSAGTHGFQEIIQGSGADNLRASFEIMIETAQTIWYQVGSSDQGDLWVSSYEY